jgi:hypothetical protein
MNRLEELKVQIEALSPTELHQLLAWFADYDAALWDQQFEHDALTGRFDALADQALNDLSQGRTTDL